MNIQQLRAQIAALQDATMDENMNFLSTYDEGRFDALSAVDALLYSLQEEPVSEDLDKAAEKYAHEAYSHPVDRNVGKADFIAGANWADEHPRKGLVDIDKVCEFLRTTTFPYKLIEKLRKAMEG